MERQQANAATKSVNLQYASDVLGWVSDGAEPVLNYNTASGGENCRIFGEEEEEEDYSVCGILQAAAKKRRLSANQIQLLEKSFDMDNKLEPERKIQMAKDLGLLPRQVAVWFQNRRARSKTKNLEKEYVVLKSRHDSLKTDHERLLSENSRLQKEVMSLKLEIRETEKAPVQAAKPEQFSVKLLSETKVEEAASSVKSGVFDSESPYFAEADRRAWVETANSSSHVLEGDEIHLPELEDSASIFTSQDHHFWSWPY